MARLRTLVAVIIAVAATGAGAAWAAGGGSSKTPSTTTPGTTMPGTTTPRADHNCPHMGTSGSSSSNGAAYAPSGPMNL